MPTNNGLVLLQKTMFVCCFGSENGLKLENRGLMFSSSEIVSWKKSSKIDFDLLSLRNFMLYLSHSLAGEFCVWVKVLLMILARN